MDSGMFVLAVSGVLVGCCVFVLYGLWNNPYDRMPKGARKLPGPWSIPLIGRVHDIPPVRTWLHFFKWSEEFGPIFRHELFGTTHVWISSEAVAKDLLAKQGSIFSDRPLINNLPFNKTGGEYLALLGENDIWVRQRKHGHQLMAVSNRNLQYEYPALEAKRLLYKLLFSPSSYKELLEEHTSRTSSRLAWGDPNVAPTLLRVTKALLTVISPSGAVPNVIKPLAYLPQFISPWKQYEVERYAFERAFFTQSLAKVRQRWLAGTSKPCYARTILEAQEKSQVNDLEGAYLVGMMAIAGAMTASSPMTSFVLAMILNPDWLSRLQEEVDRVCGDEMPALSDMSNLPTLRAVVKEVMRWRPPVPTGIPHSSTKDFIYNGYFIPAGSAIHAFEWAITRDPAVYPNPDAFQPERWLDPSYPTYKEPLSVFPRLEGHSQFGYGRRACMGVDTANHELLLVCGAMAWGFNMSKKIDRHGVPVEVQDLEYSSLLITKPDVFPCDIWVRSVARKEKMEDMWREIKDE